MNIDKQEKKSLAIKTRGLVKNYGKVRALDGFDLDVREGELLALLGANGAGKSTAIGVLTGLIEADGGEAEIFGMNIKSDRQRIKPLVAVSLQESAVAGNLTVFENLAFIAQIYGFSSTGAKQKTERIIAEFSLESVREKQAKSLSGGFARRLSIAMALIGEPKLLFLDEPTLGLDILSRRGLWLAIERLKGKITIVLTTHYLEEAEALADRVVVISEGKSVADGTVEELKAATGSATLSDAFVKLTLGDFAEIKGTSLQGGENL